MRSWVVGDVVHGKPEKAQSEYSIERGLAYGYGVARYSYWSCRRKAAGTATRRRPGISAT